VKGKEKLRGSDLAARGRRCDPHDRRFAFAAEPSEEWGWCEGGTRRDQTSRG
jgi:hypothetical protein